MTTAADEPSHVCRKVVYRGRVQGVGFRYTTQGIARKFAVVGYVKNLLDGTVELVVEGAGAVVEEFLSAVAKRFHAHITRVETETWPAKETLDGFSIRY